MWCTNCDVEGHRGYSLGIACMVTGGLLNAVTLTAMSNTKQHWYAVAYSHARTCSAIQYSTVHAMSYILSLPLSTLPYSAVLWSIWGLGCSVCMRGLSWTDDGTGNWTDGTLKTANWIELNWIECTGSEITWIELIRVKYVRFHEGANLIVWREENAMD
jgi:hypothetical protein